MKPVKLKEKISKSNRNQFLMFSNNSIKLLSNNIVKIDELSFRSPDVYKYLESAKNPAEQCISAIETGVTVLKRTQASVDVDFISEKATVLFNNLQNSIIDYVQKTMDPMEATSISAKVGKIFQNQNLEVKNMINKGDKNLSTLDKKIEEFKKSLEDVFEKSVGKTLLNETSGLGLLLKRIQDELQSMKNMIVTKETRETSSISEIGSSFEEKCMAALEVFSEAHNLILEDLRTTPGIGKSKKGDFRITGTGDITPIALEMKNYSSRVSHPSLIKEIEGACKNRNCELGILVADKNMLPKSVGAYAEYGENGNRIVTSFDVFEVALKVAYIKAKCVNDGKKGVEDIDIPELNEQVNRLKTAILKFSKLRVNCSSMRKTAEKIDTIAQDVKTEISETVDQMVSALRGKK